MSPASESRRRWRIVIGSAEKPAGPPLTKSLERSMPWDAEEREVACAGDAGS